MREISLSQGKVALVDDEDYERLIGFGNWYAWKPRHSDIFYAMCMVSAPKRTAVRMHRVILNTAFGIEIDHWDRDGLNNQKYNLREATRSQNLANTRKRKNKSGFRGVYQEGGCQTFFAQITINGKYTRVASGFLVPADAAKEYDAAASKAFGEFANLNFPQELVK